MSIIIPCSAMLAPHFSQINLKAQFRDQKPEFLGLT